jgi:glycosyltransferase involved in cell wall biosynthesis
MHNCKKRISILISSKDRKEKLKRLLETLNTCAIPGNTEANISIVDNASDDPYCKVELQALVPNLHIKLIRTDRPGRSKILNSVAAAETSDYFVFLDDDVEVPSDLLLSYMAMFGSSQHKLIAGRVFLSEDIRTGLTDIGLTSLANFMPKTKFVGSVIGANFACTRDVFDEIGGFDVALGPGTQLFGDDTLFGYEYVNRYGLIPVSTGQPVIHLPDVSRITIDCQIKFIETSCLTEAYICRKLAMSNYRITLINLWKVAILYLFSFTLKPLVGINKQVERYYLRCYKSMRLKLAFLSFSSTVESK